MCNVLSSNSLVARLINKTFTAEIIIARAAANFLIVRRHHKFRDTSGGRNTPCAACTFRNTLVTRVCVHVSRADCWKICCVRRPGATCDFVLGAASRNSSSVYDEELCCRLSLFSVAALAVWPRRSANWINRMDPRSDPATSAAPFSKFTPLPGIKNNSKKKRRTIILDSRQKVLSAGGENWCKTGSGRKVCF
jgi:hypothetical protein